MTGKDYAKKHGGNIGLEKAFIRGELEMIERIQRVLGYHFTYDACCITKRHLDEIIENLKNNVNN